MRPAEFVVHEGDAADVMRRLPAASVQAIVTSPPYYGLRDYGDPGQLGLERTPWEYVERLADTFDEAHRVLRDDGVLWLNLGDSYATRWASVRTRGGRGTRGGTRERTGQTRPGFKEKDLMGMPWLVAFELQQRGWWLRRDVVWAKPNPTPESTSDRPSSSHEFVFLFTKALSYFYDVDGFREPAVSDRPSGNDYRRQEQIGHNGRGQRNPPNRWELSDTRAARDVWIIPTVPFPGAHFAVFPPELPRRCILLGSSPRACERCRAPWVRLLERRRLLDGELVGGSSGDANGRPIGAEGVSHARFRTERRTLGWRPTCACGAPPGVQPGDLDEIATPAGDGGEGDPSPAVGRGGLARPRGEGAGTRPMSRWEQRQLARQLAGSPHREAMEGEAGREAFAHYMRTDAGGARAIRPPLLEAWAARGWVERVPPPPAWWDEADTSRCLVLDPFAGAGTTGRVAVDNGRDFIGVELNAEYAQMARDRIGEVAAAPRFEFLDV